MKKQTTPIVQQIEQRLKEVFNPQSLLVEDESKHHIGHPGAQAGGHFMVTITSAAFIGQSALEQHRMVYQALEKLMQNQIHALRISTQIPNDNATS